MSNHDPYRAGADDVTRRAFLGGASRALLGLSAVPSLGAGIGNLADLELDAVGGWGDEKPIPLGPATAKSVIYLYMSGGMSHLDTLDPKPGEETMGPTEVIPTNVDGIQLGQHLPLLAQQMDKACVINSMWSNQGAHAQGRYFMHTSYPMRGTIRHPSLGAWLSRMAGRRNPTLPGHVSVGGDIHSASGGFFESRHYPLPIGDPSAGLSNSRRAPRVTEEVFHRRLSRLERMNAEFAQSYGGVKSVRAYAEMYDQAVKLMESKDLLAFDVSQESEAMRAAYGSDRFGQGCLLARRLVEHGVRFIEVVSGGWDTHNQNFDAMEDKLPAVDRALSTLLMDLDARGLLDETLVVLTTEFGRTPDVVKERQGRNHYPKAFSSLLAGGGIRGGQKFGSTCPEGREIVRDKVTVQAFNATIAHALGMPVDHVLHSPSGRPFQVAHKGKPVMELFG